jgi:hypothetical protein
VTEGIEPYRSVMRPFAVLLLAGLVLAAACGPPQLSGAQAAAVMAGSGLSTEERQEYFGSCAFDSECEMTTFSGCCDACPGKVRVTSKKRLEREQEPCKEATCTKPDATGSCTPSGDMNAFRPVCRLRACDAVPRGG